jgi:hypothetical protein
MIIPYVLPKAQNDRLFAKIKDDQLLQEFVPVEPADEASRIVKVGDISRILRQDVSYDLIDGVVALLPESVINRR